VAIQTGILVLRHGQIPQGVGLGVLLSPRAAAHGEQTGQPDPDQQPRRVSQCRWRSLRPRAEIGGAHARMLAQVKEQDRHVVPGARLIFLWQVDPYEFRPLVRFAKSTTTCVRPTVRMHEQGNHQTGTLLKIRRPDYLLTTTPPSTIVMWKT